MAYNPYRWYTSGKYRKKPLKSSAPLLLKIRNGDFEYSPFFMEAQDNDKLYDEMYNYFMDTSPIKNVADRNHEAHQYAKMKRIKANKLREKADIEEKTRLHQLRKELTAEFGQDLWEKSMEANIGGRGTTEDLYWWYKKKVGMGTTPSEMAIQLGRKTTNGLRP